MDVLFLGKDNRYDVVIETLQKKYNVECIGYEKYKVGDLNNISKYDIIVLPMSGIKNGKVGSIELDIEIFNNIKDNCIIYTGVVPKELKKGKIISFLSDKEIIKENTNITVDGMIERIKNIKKDKICILGYGNIGSLIYSKLCDKYDIVVGVKDKKIKNLNSFLTSNEQLMKYYLLNSDLIINTVPNNIIEEKYLNDINGYILDVASYPYGINSELVNKYNLNYDLYLSIPSKFDPRRAGKILLKKFN